jgi:hypothetical protein
VYTHDAQAKMIFHESPEVLAAFKEGMSLSRFEIASPDMAFHASVMRNELTQTLKRGVMMRTLRESALQEGLDGGEQTAFVGNETAELQELVSG